MNIGSLSLDNNSSGMNSSIGGFTGSSGFTGISGLTGTGGLGGIMGSFVPSISPEMMKEMQAAQTLSDAQGTSLSEKLDSIELSKNAEAHLGDPNISQSDSDITKMGIQSEMDDLMLSGTAQSLMNQINGTQQNDTITATPNQDGSLTIDVNGQKTTYSKEEVANGFVINSGDGNDVIDVSASDANFIINSGEGNNTVSLGSGRNITLSGNGNNTITNQNTAKRNSVTTGSGSNDISLGASTNKVKTNGGSNTITASQGSINQVIDKNQTQNASTINLDTDKTNFVSTQGDTNITVGNGNNEISNVQGKANITAGDGDNVITGGDKGNNITVGNGNNYIEGGAGDDTIVAGDGNNTIYGLDGNDTITAGNGDNYIDGGKGNDTITAGTGKNIVAGGIGKDTITVAGKGGIVIEDDKSSTINAEGNDVRFYDSKATASLGQSVVSYGDSNFHQRVQSDLEVLRATESGKKLLSELDKSGHTVTVQKTFQRNGFEKATNPLENYKGFVKPDGSKGDGTDSTISYNPSFNGPANGRPISTLFHEAVHAYNTTTGTMMKGPITEHDKNGNTLGTIQAYEHQAVGLSMDGFDPVVHPDGTNSASNPEGISENALRKELGLDLRETYL